MSVFDDNPNNKIPGLVSDLSDGELTQKFIDDLSQEQELIDQIVAHMNEDNGSDAQFLQAVEDAFSQLSDPHPAYVQFIVGLMFAFHDGITAQEEWGIFKRNLEDVYNRRTASSQSLSEKKKNLIDSMATSLWDVQQVPSSFDSDFIMSLSPQTDKRYVITFYVDSLGQYQVSEGDLSGTVQQPAVVDATEIRKIVERVESTEARLAQELDSSVEESRLYWKKTFDVDVAFLYNSKRLSQGADVTLGLTNYGDRFAGGLKLFYISEDDTMMYQPRDVAGNKIGAPLPVGSLLPARTALRKLVNNEIVSYVIPSGVVFGGGSAELEQAILNRHYLKKNPTTGTYEKR